MNYLAEVSKIEENKSTLNRYIVAASSQRGAFFKVLDEESITARTITWCGEEQASHQLNDCGADIDVIIDNVGDLSTLFVKVGESRYNIKINTVKQI